MSSSSQTPAQWVSDITYNDDDYLQTCDVCVPSATTQASGGLQIVPSRRVTAHSGARVGYASVNYRFSPSDKHPQNQSTPAFERRNAKWPEHLEDVCAAVRQLQSKYYFGTNYIIAGHSVGATLALLVALKAREFDLAPPTAVLGLSGIYDFPLLHKAHPEYEALTYNAMAREAEIASSPALHDVQAYLTAGVSHVLLAHSRDDGLVPWDQVERMEQTLKNVRPGYVQTLELFGKHNDIWADGQEVARAINALLESLRVGA
ncbi:hypothetical protein A1O7_08246 [Cladophialophora yegresii CBS 114405]|uniref:BD-FAE-like domain-containing protein n=1 Tax=Cladophialophora yegresii CBS 114405 TaxID=1182544 RepID=W9W9T7_9EURO|nr:uncharacterized protein A1O7_08246 [Cladophialophora yegresii CBS 114405]EXJ55319.1 hypothetical protein A1O7_08246 [Cladophialophora yegresii CBS 114405]